MDSTVLKAPFCHIDSTTAGAQNQSAQQLIHIDSVPGTTSSGRELCQIESTEATGSMRRPAVLYGPARILWNLRHQGVRCTIRIILRSCMVSAGTRWGLLRPPRTALHQQVEVLGLNPGDVVEVRSFEEILHTLDVGNRHRGLVFTPEMRKHCGRRYRVFKRLELMFDEYRHVQRRLKNTVLLENVHCTGEGIGCDRACFLYWREVWLRRVEGGADVDYREEKRSSHAPVN